MTSCSKKNQLKKLSKPIDDLRHKECLEDCGCCKVPFKDCNIESSPIKINVKNPSMKSNGRLTDNTNVKNSPSNAKSSGKREENRLLKKCSVRLLDIGSVLDLDSININDIDVPHFTDNHEGLCKIVDSSLNKRRELTDYKEKDKGTPTKTKSSVDDIKLYDDNDCSFKSLGSESEEDSLPEKSKSKGKTESVLSDDSIHNKGEKYKLYSGPLFSDDSDDNQKEKESCLTEIIKNLNDEEVKLPKNGKKRKKINGFNAEMDSYSKQRKDSAKTMSNDSGEQTLRKQKRTMRMSSSSLEELVFASPEAESCNKTKDIQLKKCSVLLHDFGSRLCSDSININDIDVLLFTDGHEGKNDSVYSTLSEKKKFINHKRKVKKNSMKAKSPVKDMESDDNDSFKSSGSENRNMSKPDKSKFKKTVKSDSSDDFISPSKKMKKKFSISVSSDEDDEQDEKEKKKQSKRNLSKEQESHENGKKEKQLKKRHRQKYIESSDSEEDGALEKKKKLPSRSASHKSIIDSDSSSIKSLDAENKEANKSGKPKYKKKVVSDSSEDFALPKKKGEIKFNISVSSKEDEEEDKKKRPVKTREKRESKRNLPREKEPGENRKNYKQLRKRQQMKYCTSSDSEEEATLKKKKILPSRSESPKSSINSDSIFKDFSDSEREQSKPEKSKSKKGVKSDSLDESLLSKKKKRRKSSSTTSDEDNDEKEDKEKDMKKREKGQRRRILLKDQESDESEKKEKQLRKRQQVKYHQSSDSEEDDFFEKKKILPSRTESRKSSIISENSSKDSLNDNESLDSENEEASKHRKSKSTIKMKSGSLDDSVLSKTKRKRKSTFPITSDTDDDDEKEDKEKIRNKKKKRQGKRIFSKEQESDESGKKEKPMRKRQQVKYSQSSDSEEEDSLEKKKKLQSRTESDIDSDPLVSDWEDSISPKKKNRKSCSCGSSDEKDMDDWKDMKRVINKKNKRKPIRKRNSSEDESDENEEKALRKRHQVKYHESSSSEDA